MSDLSRVEQVWPDLAPILYALHNEQEYQALVAVLDALLDA